MKREQIKTRMITWAIHNTRISERMIEFWVQLSEPVVLTGKDEIEISGYIADIVQQHKQGVATPCINILAYNICRDHIHIILQCTESERDNIVRKLKWKSTQLYKNKHNIKEVLHLRWQKYNYSEIKDEKYLYNAIEYIKTNREHHRLPTSKGLQPLVHTVVCKNYIFDRIQYK